MDDATVAMHLAQPVCQAAVKLDDFQRAGPFAVSGSNVIEKRSHIRAADPVGHDPDLVASRRRIENGRQVGVALRKPLQDGKVLARCLSTRQNQDLAEIASGTGLRIVNPVSLPAGMPNLVEQPVDTAAES